MCRIKAKYLSPYSKALWSCLYFQAKTNGVKRTHEGSPKKYPWLRKTFPICLFTKVNTTYRGPTIDVSNFSPGFMHQMEFLFSNVERKSGFNSTFVAIFYATSRPFEFPSRRKHPPPKIPKFIVTTLMNKYKKVTFIRVD